MSGRLIQRRGTAADHATFVGAEGEITFDNTNKRLIAHDGSTVGGVPAAKLNEVVTAVRTPVPDIDYSVLITDRIVAYTSITGARIISLPSASAFPVGVPLWIVDESGDCSAINTISIVASDEGLIDGERSVAIVYAYGSRCLSSDGINKWTALFGEATLSQDMIGINAVADSINKLSVNSSDILFNNIGGGIQVKLNKKENDDTASILFQTGFSGRAEIGTAGNNDFHFKVSPDGVVFHDAIQLEGVSGAVVLPGGQLRFPGIQNPSSDSTTFDDYREGSWSPFIQFGGSEAGITYFFQYGRYTKIGNRVFADLIVALSSKGSAAGPVTIGGLPFAQTSGINGNVGATYYGFMVGLSGQIGGYIGAATDVCFLTQSSATGVGAVTEANFTDFTQLQLHLSFFV